MSRSTRVALVCFVAVALLAISFSALRPVDDAVARAVQIARDCGSDARAERLGTIVVGMLALATMIVARRPPSLGAVAVAVTVIVGGASFCELLKTVFERLRPDSMPGGATGNAFPSGHVMNTTLAAAILWMLAGRAERSFLERGAIRVLLVAAVVIQSLSRLFLGAHWASDVAASVLLAVGWVAGTAVVAAWPPLHLFASAGAALGVGLLFYALPGLRPRLPSPLDGGPPIAEIDVARPGDRAALRGDWELGHREPIGEVAWLREVTGGIALPPPYPPSTRLELGIRPTTVGGERAPACVELVISVNAWTSPPIVLVTGWRDVRFLLPRDVWRPEGNELRLRVSVDERTRREHADYGLLGLRYVRLSD